ncbi:MAG: PEGA domain-containing protein [Magnetococcales bacterium]|nr:PEGA domain-containing protein [Magnetococcales bacterium]
MTKMFGKATKYPLEPSMEGGEVRFRPLEPPITPGRERPGSWRAWVGWGIAAVVVVTAGPLILDRIDVKGVATPVSMTGDSSVRPISSGNLGTIHAVSEPAGAGVLLDGRFVGVTPLRFQWGAGPVTLTLKKNGFQDLNAPLEVAMAKEVDFRVSLQPETLTVAGVKRDNASLGSEATGATARSGRPGGGDGSLRLANVITHPPEVKSNGSSKPSEKGVEKSGAEKASGEKSAVEKPLTEKSGAEKSKEERSKPGKSSRTRKPEIPTEADMAGITAQDVREISKDPELAALLRKPDASASDNLNFAYAIQLAAFVDRDSAIRNAALWRKRGYDAYVLELWGIKDPTKMWQSVRVGRFTDLPQARQALEALKRYEKDQEKVKEFYVARSDAFTGPEVASTSRSAKATPPPSKGVESSSAIASNNAVDKRSPEGSGDIKDETKQATPTSLAANDVGSITKGHPSTWPEAPVETTNVAPTPLPAVPPTPRKSEPGVDAARPKPADSASGGSKPEDVKPVEVAQTEKKRTESPVKGRADKPVARESKPEAKSVRGAIAGVDPGMAPTGQPDPATKEVVASMAGGSEPDKDHLLNARKEVALQPSGPVMNGTAKDVVAEASRSGAARPPEARKASEKRKGEGVTKNEGAKIAADQSAWVERTYQQSVVKKEAGDREGEEGLLMQVIKADSGHKAAVRRMARIMVESNRADKALDMLRQAAGGRGDTSLADEDPNLAAFLAALYQRREEHWQAIDLYEALLKKYPNKGLWQMGMGISLEKVDENAEAMRAYKKALASGDLNLKLQNFVRKRIEKL